MSGLPSFDRATASSRPFGAHAGAPLMPGNEVIKSRLPDVRSCTQTCERLFSNDTYARHLTSLAHAGDISGCGDCRITFGSKPSAAAAAGGGRGGPPAGGAAGAGAM